MEPSSNNLLYGVQNVFDVQSIVRASVLGSMNIALVMCPAEAVAARKDDAPAAHHAALTKIAGRGPCSDGGGLIHTTSG